MTRVTAVTAGSGYTCALTEGGGVKCWGKDELGQLGNGMTTTTGCQCVSTPVDVTGLTSGVAAVSAGEYHACALTSSGGVKCWGYNGDGQLGNGTTINSTTPVDVMGLTNGVAAISAGSFHACAVTTAGGVKCWGNNISGQLGNGATADAGTPVDVTGLTSGVAAVSAGLGHTCVLSTAGGVKCWGANLFGELGNGTRVVSATPVDVISLTNGVAAVSASRAHTCALSTDGGVKCWGSNREGELGDGQTCGFVCATPVNVSGLASGVAAVSVGGAHTCALVGGSARCWGEAALGQLGNGTSTGPEICGEIGLPCSTEPIDVSGLTSGVTAVSAGDTHTCAVNTDVGLQCWGDNSVGQLGNGTAVGPQRCYYQVPCSTTPVRVFGLAVPLLGDPNCDGAINAVDAALILQLDARLIASSACDQSADVNHDGQVNSLDAVLILQYSAGLLSHLPP